MAAAALEAVLLSLLRPSSYLSLFPPEQGDARLPFLLSSARPHLKRAGVPLFVNLNPLAYQPINTPRFVRCVFLTQQQQHQRCDPICTTIQVTTATNQITNQITDQMLVSMYLMIVSGGVSTLLR